MRTLPVCRQDINLFCKAICSMVGSGPVLMLTKLVHLYTYKIPYDQTSDLIENFP